MATATKPGSISAEDLHDAMHHLTRYWSGLEVVPEIKHLEAATIKIRSREPSDCGQGGSEAVTTRGGDDDQFLQYCMSVVGPLGAPSNGSAEHAKTNPMVSSGEMFEKDPKKKLLQPLCPRSASDKLQVMLELHFLADCFHGEHKGKIDDECHADVCGILQDYDVSSTVHLTLLKEIIIPIVGEAASKLWQTVCAFTVIREVLRRAPSGFRQEEVEEMTQNGGSLGFGLLHDLMGGQGTAETLRFGHDTPLKSLPEKDQATLKRLLADTHSADVPSWRRFAEVNFREKAEECTNIDLFWIMLRDADYTVGKMYGHLIAAGLLQAARKLEQH